jgi:ribosome-associated protein
LVIVSAYSDRQTSAIADAIVDELKNEYGLRPMVREGQGSWVLIDYGDVVIHVFHEDARAFYDLERLWSKAPRVPVPAFETASASAMTH